MKRVILSAVLLLGIGMLAVGSYLYITGRTEEIIGKVQLVEKHLDEEDYEAALSLSEEAGRLWKDFSERRNFIVADDSDTEITLLFSKIIKMTEAGDKNVQVECSMLLDFLCDYLGKHELRAANVL